MIFQIIPFKKYNFWKWWKINDIEYSNEKEICKLIIIEYEISFAF